MSPGAGPCHVICRFRSPCLGHSHSPPPAPWRLLEELMSFSSPFAAFPLTHFLLACVPRKRNIFSAGIKELCSTDNVGQKRSMGEEDQRSDPIYPLHTSECALLTPKSSSPTQCLQETPACFCILLSFLFLLLRWPRKHL